MTDAGGKKPAPASSSSSSPAPRGAMLRGAPEILSALKMGYADRHMLRRWIAHDGFPAACLSGHYFAYELEVLEWFEKRKGRLAPARRKKVG